MPLDRDIAAVLAARARRAAAGSERSVSLAAARVAYERDVRELTPSSRRAAAASVEEAAYPAATGTLPVRIYRPLLGRPSPRGAGPLPTIVYFHGGGWVNGSLDTADILARALCAGARAVVVATEYRLAPKHPYPAALDDAHAALAWAASMVSTLGGDAGAIAVGGDSAGANLAAALTLRAREAGTRIAAQILFYPYLDLSFERLPRYHSMLQYASGYYVTLDDLRGCVRRYLRNAASPDQPEISPLCAGSVAGLPPALIALAEFDPLRDQGQAFADRLDAAGVPVVIRPGTGLVHGYGDLVGVSAAARGELRQVTAAARSLLSRGHQFEGADR
jgi:acetyl esterase